MEEEIEQCQVCGSDWTKFGKEINGKMVWWCGDHDPSYVHSYEERKEMLRKIEDLQNEKEELEKEGLERDRIIEISKEIKALYDEIYQKNDF